MDPLYAKWIAGLGWVAMGAIRAIPKVRAFRARAAKRESGTFDLSLLMLAGISALPAFLWLFSPALTFADYPLHPGALLAGTPLLACGAWLLYRAHADLGRNFSYLLEIQPDHRLVTAGIYRSIRHPMYTSFLMFVIGHALVVPNYVAGPAFAVAMIPLIVTRLGPEERMMTEEFGEDYTAYCRRTNRLIPGIF